MTTARDVLGPTHVEWQAQVVELAHYLGYNHLHVRRSIGGRTQGWKTTTNLKGWPDLLCFGPKGFVALELKVGKDKATPEQLQVLAELEAAGARVMVAYPGDLPAVVELLGGSTNRSTG